MTNQRAIILLSQMYLPAFDEEEKQAIDKAIEVLSAQEPMLVRHTPSTIRCPKCNKQITSRGAIHNEIHFCWKCGQAVKW